MASFKSNLNSVPSTHRGLAVIKNRLTTCFKQILCKILCGGQRIDTTQKRNLNYYYPQYESLEFLKWNQKKFINRNTGIRNVEILSTKSKKILLGKQLSRSKNQNYHRVQIIAKLLSSTVIATTTPSKKRSFCNSDTNSTLITVNKTEETLQAFNEMTITEDTFVLIREEYPDLDIEVRSILMARAQTGATIGEIREDYRKNTGMNFPVFDHVTEFLLCIRGITAYCNDRGTLIFNVRPSEKTKHIYDLVTNQKAPSERSVSTAYSYKPKTTNRDSGFYSTRSTVAPLSWRSGNLNRHQQPNCNNNHIEYQHENNVEEANIGSELENHIEPRAQNKEGCYEDNCQHLYHRLYIGCENGNNTKFSNYKPVDPYKPNNFNLNDKQIEILNSTLNNPNINQWSQSSQSNKDLKIFKRPEGRAIRRPAAPLVHLSSPSGTKSSRTCDSQYSSDLDYEAHLLDFPLLGDDFFLYLARMELKCKFKKFQKILQSGMCVSGQTITAAIRRVHQMPFRLYNNRVIVNIGSVDIMQGRSLVQIEHDFRTLINVMNKRGLTPILTTLAPLANYSHDSAVKFKLERFNEFVKREGEYLLVIDIWARFVNDKKQTLFDCYQNEPRQVTGAKEPYVFWNKIGRQRVLQTIESVLEY